MPTDISQLRPEGVEAALAFAKTVNCELDHNDVDPLVSLIAKEGDAIVAVVLGRHDPGGACLLHVCLGKLDDPDALTGELLNKALMKVHGAGVRRCQITHHGPDQAPADWPGHHWIAPPGSTPAPGSTTGSEPESESEAA